MEYFRQCGDFGVIALMCCVFYGFLILGLIVRAFLWLVRKWWYPIEL
jgi:hypothetical protein